MAIHRFFFVGTLAWYFLFINLAKIPLFFDLDLFTAQTIGISAALLPVIPVGVIAGRWLNKKMSDKLFYRIGHLALVLLGIRLIWTSVG
jgi:putative Ca2+/H+ antiporter (TMEM165/GDT1 family)